jgi:hypothetical protein
MAGPAVDAAVVEFIFAALAFRFQMMSFPGTRALSAAITLDNSSGTSTLMPMGLIQAFARSSDEAESQFYY